MRPPKSLTPCKVPALVPETYLVISMSNKDILSFRALGTLFAGAHVCAKNTSYIIFSICARTAFVCPYVPILLYIYIITKVSSCFYVVCSNEKTGSQAGKKQGVRESAPKTEVLA